MSVAWRGAVVGAVALLMIILSATVVLPQPVTPSGVEPRDAWTCPATHPIKGNFTTYSGEPCIHQFPAASSTARRSRSAVTRPRRRREGMGVGGPSDEAPAVEDGALSVLVPDYRFGIRVCDPAADVLV
jgi:hypothetical protein